MELRFDYSDFRENPDKYRLFKTAIATKQIGNIPANVVVRIKYIQSDLNTETLRFEPMYEILDYVTDDAVVLNTSKNLVPGSYLSHFVL
jgi:hypothetical protein